MLSLACNWQSGAHDGPCMLACRSKSDVLRLLRRLVCARVLREDTFRADNQYGNVTSHLSVNGVIAARLGSPALRIVMPFLVKEPAAQQQEAPAAGGNARKKAPGGRKGKRVGAADASQTQPRAADADVEVIEDDDEAENSRGMSQVRAVCPGVP